VRDFSRQNGWKIQVKPKYRLQPEIANLVSRRTYCCKFYLHFSVQTFWSVYYSLPFYLRNFPIRGRAILLQQTAKFSKKKRFNSKRRNIHQHFMLLTEHCKVFVKCFLKHRLKAPHCFLMEHVENTEYIGTRYFSGLYGIDQTAIHIHYTQKIRVLNNLLGSLWNWKIQNTKTMAKLK
jgi:hypothetical protein